MLIIQQMEGEFKMKNNWKNIVKKVVAGILLAGILVTVPCTGTGGEPGIMPCGDLEEEVNRYI